MIGRGRGCTLSKRTIMTKSIRKQKIPLIEVDLFYLNEKRDRSDETEEKRMARGVVLGDDNPDLTYLRSHT